MSLEIALVCFGLITFATIGFEILYTYATLGFGFGFSSLRPVVEKTGFALRVERVYRNQVESTAYIVPALAAAALLGVQSPAAMTTALVIVLGRLGFVLTYYTGIPFLRVPFFVMGSFGSLYLMYLILTQGAG